MGIAFGCLEWLLPTSNILWYWGLAIEWVWKLYSFLGEFDNYIIYVSSSNIANENSLLRWTAGSLVLLCVWSFIVHLWHYNQLVKNGLSEVFSDLHTEVKLKRTVHNNPPPTRNFFIHPSVLSGEVWNLSLY